MGTHTSVPRHRAARVLLVAGIVAVGLAAGLVVPKGTPAAAASKPSYYLNLGDSLAEGYQPGSPNNQETLHGYANRLVTDVAAHHRLTLENFGCGGATSTTLLDQHGCRTGTQAVDGVSYATTSQAAAAAAFIEAHRSQVKLVTIAIGGNDFARCLADPTPGPCVAAALPQMIANIESLSRQLHALVEARTPILAVNYYDVGLANWLHGPAGQTIARTWVAEFRRTINPAFARAYAASKVSVIDLTKAFGGDTSLTTLTTLAPYGEVPYAVARLCTLSWKCARNDDHPRNPGYALIASELARAYLKLSP